MKVRNLTYAEVQYLKEAVRRGNDAIGREIVKRYLPKYLPALAEARAQRDADQAYKDKRHATLQRLVKETGDTRTVAVGDERAYLRIGEAYGNADSYGDSVNLNLHSLTLTQAEAIIKLLRGK